MLITSLKTLNLLAPNKIDQDVRNHQNAVVFNVDKPDQIFQNKPLHVSSIFGLLLGEYKCNIYIALKYLNYLFLVNS